MYRSLQLARRFSALAVSLAALLAIWPLSSEPIVWEWMGRPPEVYPEIGFAIFGLPASIVAVGSAAFIAWKAAPSATGLWLLTAMRAVNGLALAICFLVLSAALMAFLNRA